MSSGQSKFFMRNLKISKDFLVFNQAQDLVALTGRYLKYIGRSLTSAMEKKSDTQQIPSYNNPMSTIL